MNRKIYKYQLRNLGLALGFSMFFGLILHFQFRGAIPMVLEFASAYKYAAVRYIIGLLAAVLALVAWKTDKGEIFVLAVSIVLLVVSVVLTYYEYYHKIDSLIDLNLFMQGIIIYTMIQIIVSRKKWEKIVQAPPNILDLHISGKQELFDNLVIAPHLEVNADIIKAVDHFIGISPKYTSLMLCIHSTEIISEKLQSVAKEAFEMYYLDEERKLQNLIQLQYLRCVVMLVVSIASFRFLAYWSRQNGQTMLWQILGSFAAFSFWKVGDTIFENANSQDKLVRIMIAKIADIQFI